MIINRVYSNKKSFKDVAFVSSFNVVVAETQDSSTEKDSRNGLGKTLLVKIISYCLGSNLPADFKVDELVGWSFSVEIMIDEDVFTLTRNIDSPNSISISGPYDKLGIPQNLSGGNEYSVDIVKASLGNKLFGLNSELITDKKHSPSYRSLLSYFIRTDQTGFDDPFAYFSRQQSWNKQVNNSYLLGLDWELASKMNRMQAKLDELNKINKAIEDGALNDFGGNLGELETEKINLQTKLDQMQEHLKGFKVHDQYYEIQKNADKLTRQIHRLLNSVNLNEQIANKYNLDIKNNSTVDIDIAKLYNQVGVELSNKVLRHLDDVESFYIQITKDRKSYLKTEVEKMTREIDRLKDEIKDLTRQKNECMQILSSHGALEEYSLLQDEVNNQRAKVEDINSKITRLTEVEDKISQLSVDLEEMMRAMRKDYSERLPSLALAIRVFNENTEYLYEQPGKLSINPSKNGYKFKIDIKKSSSDGVSSMKVFCYDLMLAELWSTTKSRPIPLIHDSKLFDSVDERQKAKALELAYKKSKKCGFQYICTMNSDAVPYDRFTKDFQKIFDESIKVRLSDTGEAGSLLGIMF